MEITWHGLSCFTLKGKGATVVVDPYEPKRAGLKKAPKLEAGIVLANEDNSTHNTKLVEGNPKVFNVLGEYEAAGVVMSGLRAYDHPRSEDDKQEKEGKVIMFVIDIDDFRVCHLSNIGHKLTNEMTEMLGDIDILFVPVGGKRGLSAEKAHELIEQVDPRMVVPMYYKTDRLHVDADGVETFLKEMGIKSPRVEKKLKLKNAQALPQEHTEFVVMEPTI